MVERALILSGGGLLDQHHFSLDSSAHNVPSNQQGLPEEVADVRLNEAVNKLETRLIETALIKAGGSKARAAALLDISERALWYKLKKGRSEPG
jgi:two-component system response regulator AtoC